MLSGASLTARRSLAALLGGLAAALLGVACGGRSTETEFEGDPTGGSSSGAGTGATAGQDAGPGGRDPGSGGASTGGASTGSGGASTGGVATGGGPSPAGGMTGSAGFPALDGGAGECLNCVTTMCPQAQECFLDPACLQGAICASTTCTSGDAGGGLDCWLGCFDGNTQAALTAFGAFTCVATTCGTGCTGAFGP